jgi:hypothetical protein
MSWNDTFMELFARCASAYQSGNFDYKNDYSTEDLDFLKSIGYKHREFFDFIEDYIDEQEPSPTTALLIAAARRDYFIVQQNGIISDKTITRDDLPSFGEELDDIPYLPRILSKARGKIKGELDPDIMFGCGGDRNFCQKNGNIELADFLRHVWAAGDNDQKVADWVKNCRS